MLRTLTAIAASVFLMVLPACGAIVVRASDPVAGDAATTSETSLPSMSTNATSTACAGSLRRCALRCVDTQISPFHCGACGHACTSGMLCRDGVCANP
jgi:hypothetical protein